MKDMNGFPSSANDLITEKIIGCAIQVYRVLGPGFLEIIYHRAMAHELQKLNLCFGEEEAMQVIYDEIVLGDYFADFLVEQHVVVEIKAVVALTAAHEIQLVNYLNAVKFELGLLINFGGPKIEVRRKFRKCLRKSISIHAPHVVPV